MFGTTNKRRIIGIDPGLCHTGWGIVEITGNLLSYVAHGVVNTNSKDELSYRLHHLHEGLKEVLHSLTPDEAAVEETFVNKNPTSTLKLGMARGVALMTPRIFQIPVFEYTANQVKKAVVGVGHADKHQVATMVSRLLPNCQGITGDAADALAIAICQCHHSSMNPLSNPSRYPQKI